MKKIAVQTLGCKLNQFESDSLATQFKQRGYHLVGAEHLADAYIINTCTVTSKADRKSRNLMYHAQRQSAKYRDQFGANALVIVTGCFAENYKDEIAAHDNTYLVGNKKKHAIVQIVDAHLRGEIVHTDSIQDDLFAYTPAEPIYHTRGMLKIQDGCDNLCTFCIIPFVRGKAVSRDFDQILCDMRTLIAMGYREVTLTGVNISRYADGERRFSTLLAALLDVSGDFRLRISSLEPDGLDEQFFALMEHPKMTPHLHLCLQSGSEKILLQMRRQYTARQYQRIIDTIRKKIPRFNITTDIIVGFPNETDADFKRSCAVVARNRIGHVHIFPYAQRIGTRAARMDAQIAQPIIKRRSAQLAQIAERAKLRYRESLCGTTQMLLAERVTRRNNKPYLQGYSEYYVPTECAIRAEDALPLNAFYAIDTTYIQTDGEPTLGGAIAM